MINTQESFSDFANNLYLNFWNNKIHPIITDFVETEALWITSKANTKWTAYAKEPLSGLSEEIVKSEFVFNKHPHFDGPYVQCAFVLNLRKQEGETVGVISVLVCFLFSAELSCIETFDLLCNKFRSLGAHQEKRISKYWVSFSNPINTWPYEVQIRINKRENQHFAYSITFYQGKIE